MPGGAGPAPHPRSSAWPRRRRPRGRDARHGRGSARRRVSRHSRRPCLVDLDGRRGPSAVSSPTCCGDGASRRRRAAGVRGARRASAPRARSRCRAATPRARATSCSPTPTSTGADVDVFFGDERWVPVARPRLERGHGPRCLPRRRSGRGRSTRCTSRRHDPRRRAAAYDALVRARAADRPRAPRPRSRRAHRVAVPGRAGARGARPTRRRRPATTLHPHPRLTFTLSGDRTRAGSSSSPSPAPRSATRSHRVPAR